MCLSFRNVRSKCLMVLSLVSLMATSSLRQERQMPGVWVTLSPEKPLRLQITVRSGSEKSETILKSRLPWSWRYGMVLVAVKPNGDCLEMELPIEDPPGEKITVVPGAALTGEVDLSRIIANFSQVTKQSDVHVFWAYQSPEELHIAHWFGGWVLIPRQK